ncbi:MAG: protein-disulfide reductase DsbD domain-containing protein [Planctomycetota bacterium]
MLKRQATFLSLWLIALAAALAGRTPGVDADGARPSLKRSDADGYVTITALGTHEAKPGSSFTIDLQAEIESGWHMYSLYLDENLGVPTQIQVGDAGPFVVGAPTESKPKSHHSELMGGTMLEHYSKATFQLPVDVPPGTDAGSYTIPVSVRYQICDANQCLPPVTLDFAVPVTVVGSAPAASFSQKKSDDEGYVTVVATGGQVEPGATLTIELAATIESGWHMYSLYLDENLGVPTQIQVGEVDPLVPGAPTESKPKEHHSELMGGTMLEHYGNATFTLPVDIPADTPLGRYSVPLSFRYQICDASMCLPPVTLDFQVPVVVGSMAEATGGTLLANPAGGEGGAVVSGPASARAAEEDGDLIVTAKWPRVLEQGQKFDLTFETEIAAGWWIYGLEQDPTKLGEPVRIEFPKGSPIAAAGEMTESPKAKFSTEPEIGGEYYKHTDQAKFVLPVEVSADAPDGPTPVEVTFHYQLCHPLEGCKVQRSMTVPIVVAVGRPSTLVDLGASDGGPAGGTPGASYTFDAKLPAGGFQVQPGETFSVDFSGEVVAENVVIPAIEANAVDLAKQRGFWGIVLFGIVGAFFALVTPCVYPMIPITVSVFTKHAEDGKSNVFFLAIVFCLGIVVTFTGIGFLASLALGETAGQFFATDPTINLLLGALFVWFAFSLFGYYDISLPSWLTTRATGASSGGGVLSVILMGFVFSITTFTCVGPIVATLLALAVTSGGQWLSLVGMVAFSATFAVPFFFLALFPKMLQGMPRSGGWLNGVKVVLGFVELAAAFKFFAVVPQGYFGVNALFREAVLFVWGIIFLLTALYLFGIIRFPHDSPVDKRGPIRLGFVAIFLAMCGYFTWGASGRLINPNLEAQILAKSFFFFVDEKEGDPSLRRKIVDGIEESPLWSSVFETDPTHLPWKVFSEKTEFDVAAALEEVKGSGKPIFINFTGHT